MFPRETFISAENLYMAPTFCSQRPQGLVEELRLELHEALGFLLFMAGHRRGHVRLPLRVDACIIARDVVDKAADLARFGRQGAL